MNKGQNSVYKMLGASNHCDDERQKDDFYATDPKAIEALVKVYDLPHKIWECACGEGHLAKRLTELGYDVVATDLVDRGYGLGGVDFLAQMECGDCKAIVTNPPYKDATEFVLHALDILPNSGVCAMFLKTTFLEGQRRYDKLFRKYPPKYMFQFIRRIMCAKNGDFKSLKDKGGAIAEAWYIWEKGFKGDTIVRWI